MHQDGEPQLPAELAALAELEADYLEKDPPGEDVTISFCRERPRLINRLLG